MQCRPVLGKEGVWCNKVGQVLDLESCGDVHLLTRTVSLSEGLRYVGFPQDFAKECFLEERPQHVAGPVVGSTHGCFACVSGPSEPTR